MSGEQVGEGIHARQDAAVAIRDDAGRIEQSFRVERRTQNGVRVVEVDGKPGRRDQVPRVGV